jgi:hypothetical protein
MRGAIGDLPLFLILDRLDTGDQSSIQLAGQVAGSGTVDHTQHAAPGTGPDGADRYVADALVLPPGSRWDASVVIGDGTGVELVRQRFTFSMGEDGLVSGVANSLADGGLAADILLVFGGMVSLGLGLGRLTLPRTEAVASRIALLGGGTLAALTGVALTVGRLVGAG